MSRPVPRHAASAIFSEGDKIYLILEASKGYTTELSFPATLNGLGALLKVLREREIASAQQPWRIADKGMPIQYVVDSWMKDPQVAQKAINAKRAADLVRFQEKSKKDRLTELLSDLIDAL